MLQDTTLTAFQTCVERFYGNTNQSRSDKVMVFQKMRCANNAFISRGQHIAVATPNNLVWFATFLELWEYVIVRKDNKEENSHWLHVKLWKQIVFDNIQKAITCKKQTIDNIPVGFNFNVVRSNLCVAEDQILDEVFDLMDEGLSFPGITKEDIL